MDIQHYYIEKGQGDETIILLHGNGEDCTYFVGQIDEFARQYHVYAIDTRGHGRTPRGNAPFTIRQFADDLLEFIQSKETSRLFTTWRYKVAGKYLEKLLTGEIGLTVKGNTIELL